MTDIADDDRPKSAVQWVLLSGASVRIISAVQVMAHVGR